MWLLALLIWLFCGIGAAKVAQDRGANGCLWFFLGVVLGPIGLAMAFISGVNANCPYCKERIHPQATRCPRCQATLSPAIRASEIPEPLLGKQIPDNSQFLSLGLSQPKPTPSGEFCVYCGAANQPTAKFCNGCGKQIDPK